MLFSEIYGSYYNVVAEVLKKAVQCDLSEKNMNDIILEKAFGESILNIPDALKSESWKLINCNMETPLRKIPSMPLTLLQKQWLKALLDDPRIKLFHPSVSGLDDVEPLYKQETLEYFDRYSDGDDFEAPEYIMNFHVILKALKENKKLKMKYTGRQWKDKEFFCSPIKLEYSSKDDKFRLIAIAYKKHLHLIYQKSEAVK